MIYKELKNFGLTSKEAKTYLATLELGETTVSRIAKKSGINRTTTYLTIEALKEKGLISSIKKQSKSFFYAESPKKLKEKEEEKLESLNKVMPELMSLANLIDKKPKIRYFEGNEGIRDVYKDTLKYPSQEILGWYSNDRIDYFDESFVLDYYMNKRIKSKINLRMFAIDSEFMSRMKKQDHKHLRQMKLIESNQFSFSAEINLYGNDKIAIVAHKENIALIIESRKIFNTLKSIFEIMWMSLPY